jgi:hypothetical protein
MIAGASGDTATWVGSIGTCAVGILAAVIAWVQYNHSRFRPQVHAYHDLKGRVVVRVTNEGAGTGTVEDVDLLSGDPSSPALTYVWETTGSDNDKRTPIPFTLPGLSTAQLVMQPTKAKAVTPATRARVTYGNGRRSRPIEITKVAGTIFGTTTIPGAGP